MVCGGAYVGCFCGEADGVGHIFLLDMSHDSDDKLIRCRFKGAYCTVYEKQALPELFGEMEVTADSLPEMATGIIASEG